MYWADGGHLSGRLVGDAVVPLRGLGLAVLLRVRRRGGLGLRGWLLHRLGRRGLAHDLALGVRLVHLRLLLLLLLDRAGGVQSVCGRLSGGRVGVEAFLCGRSSRRRRVAAGAVLDAIARGGVGNLKWESLSALARHLLVLVLRMHWRGRRVRVCVHGGDAGVALLGDEVAVLRQARGPLKHLDAVVLLRRLLVARVGGLVLVRHAMVVVGTARQAVAVGVWLRHAVAAWHVLAKLGEGLCALGKVAVMAHHVRWPWHTVVALWCRRGIVIARLGRRVIVL